MCEVENSGGGFGGERTLENAEDLERQTLFSTEQPETPTHGRFE